MLKKIVFTCLCILISFCAIGQDNLNDYKYIIVPKKFDFLKSKDQYQLNSLTKFLFNKYGYQAYFEDDDLPNDVRSDRCLALTSEVSNEKSGMFKTKLEIILKDCYGKVIIISELGDSRLKKFDRAFIEALRRAFKTFEDADYKYIPKEKSLQTIEPKVEIEEKSEVKAEPKKIPKNKIEVKAVNVESNTSDIYYAQAKEGGYQLVDSEPKIVMLLLSTSAKDVFIVKDKNAIVYKADGEWIYFENNGSVVKNVINIKF